MTHREIEDEIMTYMRSELPPSLLSSTILSKGISNRHFNDALTSLVRNGYLVGGDSIRLGSKAHSYKTLGEEIKAEKIKADRENRVISHTKWTLIATVIGVIVTIGGIFYKPSEQPNQTQPQNTATSSQDSLKSTPKASFYQDSLPTKHR